MQGVSVLTDRAGRPAVLTIDLRDLDPNVSSLVKALLGQISNETESGDAEREEWRSAAHAALNRVYGDDEPDYSDVPAYTTRKRP